MIKRFAANEEEELLLAHLSDLLDRCRYKNIPVASEFLSPQEQQVVTGFLEYTKENVLWTCFGGYRGAERQMIFFLPDYGEEIPRKEIAAVRVFWYEGDSVTHRDLLGSVLGTGIERKCVGDILVSKEEHSADILVTRTILPYLLENYRQAGKIHLKIEEISLQHLHMPSVSVKETRDTVASLRLDGVLSSAFAISRGKASDAVRTGKVQVNWKDVQKTDATVNDGDVLTCRGLGKAEVHIGAGFTKKGRIPIVIKRFL